MKNRPTTFGRGVLAASLLILAPLAGSATALAQANPKDTAGAPTPPDNGMPPAQAIPPLESYPAQPPLAPVPALDMPPPPPPAPMPMPAPAAPAPAPREMVGGKFSADLYGFMELDTIFDSTQAFNEIAGNAVIPKSGTYGGDHQRLTYSARNSRFGVKVKGPDAGDIRSSAVLEADFLGNQPTPVSEAAFLTNPTFRIRHAMLKLETPFVDILAGQYWQLFGWQSYFFPNTVEIMGVPGEVFGRAPQLRLSHPFKTEVVTVEIALASSRPPQRDGAVPDTQGGIRFLVNGWKAAHTANSTGTAIDAGGIGVSGVVRRLRVNQLAAAPTALNAKTGGGISVDALIPVISPVGGNRSNALTLTGSYVRGTGIADLFTGLTGGVAFPSLPNPTMATPAPAYTPNIDAGIVTYGPAGDIHTIDWQSFIVGVQYYLPPTGSVWISGNYSQMDSHNISKYATGAAAARAFSRSQWADGNLFWEVNKAVRFGAEFAWFKQTFVDDSTAKNYRGQFSAFYIF